LALLEFLEALSFGGDLLAQQREVLELVADAADALGPRAAEVAVVGEHAAEGRGVLLVEQQLELLLAAVHVGRAQLAGERTAFRRKSSSRRACSRSSSFSGLGRDALHAQFLQPAARGLGVELGVAQLGAQPVRFSMSA